jgi:hypothetical protein
MSQNVHNFNKTQPLLLCIAHWYENVFIFLTKNHVMSRESTCNCNNYYKNVNLPELQLFHDANEAGQCETTNWDAKDLLFEDRQWN